MTGTIEIQGIVYPLQESSYEEIRRRVQEMPVDQDWARVQFDDSSFYGITREFQFPNDFVEFAALLHKCAVMLQRDLEEESRENLQYS